MTDSQIDIARGGGGPNAGAEVDRNTMLKIYNFRVDGAVIGKNCWHAEVTAYCVDEHEEASQVEAIYLRNTPCSLENESAVTAYIPAWEQEDGLFVPRELGKKERAVAIVSHGLWEEDDFGIGGPIEPMSWDYETIFVDPRYANDCGFDQHPKYGPFVRKLLNLIVSEKTRLRANEKINFDEKGNPSSQKGYGHFVEYLNRLGVR